MNNLSEQEHIAYAVVDDALRTAPLAPTPTWLMANVMARVYMMPRFRLEWLDYALTLFATGMFGSLLWLWRMVSPQLTPEAFSSFFAESQLTSAALLVVVTLGATGLALGMMLIAVFVLTRDSNTRRVGVR
jgi:hypothetical protein